MKKAIIISFIIGLLLCLLDVDNMAIFVITKIIGILFLLPAFSLKYE